jgi:hypothetical protein
MSSSPLTSISSPSEGSSSSRPDSPAGEDDVPDPKQACTSVPGYADIVSSPELLSLGLGIVFEYDAICCLHCSAEDRMISFSRVRYHLTKVHKRKLPRKLGKAYFASLLTRYNISSTHVSTLHATTRPRSLMAVQLKDIPSPAWPTAPLPFLPVSDAFQCLICEEKFLTTTIYDNEDTHDTHVGKVHPKTLLRKGETARPVKAQTFGFKNYSPKTWFRVEPSYEFLRKERLSALDEDMLGARPTPAEFADAFRTGWRPPDRPPVDIQALQDVQPFLFISRWAEHVAPYDTERLRALVQVPGPNEDLVRIYNAATKCFMEDQGEIAKQSEILRWRITDEGSG